MINENKSRKAYSYGYEKSAVYSCVEATLLATVDVPDPTGSHLTLNETNEEPFTAIANASNAKN